MLKRHFIKQFVLGSGGYLIACSGRAINPQEQVQDIDKHLKEIKYYVQTPRGAKCTLCPNECELKPSEEGLCRNHRNIDNKIYSTAYGNPCAVNIDPVEKKPLFHFHPGSQAFSIGTAGCTLACLNCQNWEISQKSPEETKNIELMPQQVVKECLNNNCTSIAYTYNEPLSFYEYTYDTATIAKSKGIKNILVSNGFIKSEPLKNICKILDAANIDLKSFDNDTYIKLNGGTLQPVLDSLNIIKNEGVWLEITNLIIPGWTDQLDMIRKMCTWLFNNGFSDTPLHFSRFYPAYKLNSTPITPVEILIEARKIALDAGIKYVYIGNVAGTSADNTICPKCNHTVIERKGYQIIYNKITGGKCSICNNFIAGVW